MKSTLFLLSTLALVSAQTTEPASSTTSSAAAPMMTTPPTLAPGEIYIMPYNEELLKNIKKPEDFEFLPDVIGLVGSRDGVQTSMIPAWVQYYDVLVGLDMPFNIPPFTKLDPNAVSSMNAEPTSSEATSTTTFATVVLPTDGTK
ncbi:hypothetical protein BROUX41_000129 [Berkeleyomyces rouxiae]|uniref:uncharacterized protein n=1 Tax=Berkeleyomyces rouxiae TaxID=2035830 RepID=UPI003B7767D9